MSTLPPPPDSPPPLQYDPEALEDITRDTDPADHRVQSPYDDGLKSVAIEEAVSPSVPLAGSSVSNTEDVEVSVEHTFTSHKDTLHSEAHQSTMFTSMRSTIEKATFRDLVILLGVFSLVVLVQGGVNCSKELDYECVGANAFAIASGVISLFACGMYLFAVASGKIGEEYEGRASALGFVWWAVTMIILTFLGPFSTTRYANGYFGTWLGFLVATLLMTNGNANFRTRLHTAFTGFSNKPALYLLLASIIEIGSSVKTCLPSEACVSLNAFALSLGSVSGFATLMIIILTGRVPNNVLKVCSAALCVWWVVGGLIVTFVNPFSQLGNGYFSVLAGIITSFLLLETFTSS